MIDEKLEKFKLKNNYIIQTKIECCLTCKYMRRESYDESVYCKEAGYKVNTYYGLVDYLGKCNLYELDKFILMDGDIS